jgi:hypothetical protein
MSLMHTLGTEGQNVGVACEQRSDSRLTFTLGDGPVARVAGFTGFGLLSEVDGALLRGSKRVSQGGDGWQSLALRHVTRGGWPLVGSRVHAAARVELPDSLHNLEAAKRLFE